MHNYLYRIAPGGAIIIYHKIYVFDEGSESTDLLENACGLFTRRSLRKLKREISLLALKAFIYHPRVQTDEAGFVLVTGLFYNV